jgi:ABC-type nitrate/sulfonate/bicarbonate transport system permease component
VIDRGRLAGVVGAALVVAVAWTVVAWWIAPRVTPTISDVARQMWHDRAYYGPHLRTTFGEAAWGYLWGNVAGAAVAALIVLVRPLSALLERLSVAVYCLPMLAIGPILQVVTTGATTKIALAALAVFFTTMVCCVLGLRSADPSSLDVVRAAGGGDVRQFRTVRVQAAMPSVFAGLRIAAPAALLGAIVGEYLGGTRGLGVAMILSQSSFQVARTWGLAVVIGVSVGLAYALTGLIARFLLPWASGERPITVMQLGTSRRGLLASVVTAVASVVILVAGWWATLRWFDLSPYFAKRPMDVWRFLTTVSDDRTNVMSAFGTTLVDTVVGFAIGLVASIVVAVGVVASPFLDAVVMPTAIALRSVPIIAMTPLIALLFGRGLGGVTVIVGLVTFFPTLVAATTAMRDAPRQACDLVAAYGGSRARELFGVRLPFALPALFAASKIALPAAISGALLAEWLATGSGLGSLMLRASASSKFAVVWSGAVLIVIASVLAYNLVGIVEAATARRIGATR